VVGIADCGFVKALVLVVFKDRNPQSILEKSSSVSWQFNSQSAIRNPPSVMITLLTDFGLSDYFVPAVKGVILSIHHEAQIVDITHEAAAQDVRSAAFTLGACLSRISRWNNPRRVVDPGVGSSRRAIVVDAGRYIFVGPDNGLFSFVYARNQQFAYSTSRRSVTSAIR
jgi:hypothetical protein